MYFHGFPVLFALANALCPVCAHTDSDAAIIVSPVFVLQTVSAGTIRRIHCESLPTKGVFYRAKLHNLAHLVL